MAWDSARFQELERRVIATLRQQRIVDYPYYRFLYDPSLEIVCLQQFTQLVAQLKAAGFSAEAIWLTTDVLCPAWLQLVGSVEGLARVERDDRQQFAEDLKRELPRLVTTQLSERLHTQPVSHCAVLLRVGALFPFVRVSTLLSNLEDTVHCTLVIPYPGNREGEMLGYRSADTLHGYYRGEVL